MRLATIAPNLATTITLRGRYLVGVHRECHKQHNAEHTSIQQQVAHFFITFI
jgi:hypothetical protein